MNRLTGVKVIPRMPLCHLSVRGMSFHQICLMTGGENHPRLFEKQVTLGTMAGQWCLEEHCEFSLDVHKSEKKQQEKKTKSENIETRDGGK